MSELIYTNIFVLDGVALTAAVILYFVSKKFKSKSNPKVEQIEQCLPQVNCGACGKVGCHDFATACSKSTEEEFSKLYCPVGGLTVMNKIATLLGYEEQNKKEKRIAVLRCNGSCENAPAQKIYDGIFSCQIAATVSSSPNGCPDGCLHLGDCVRACPFQAIQIDEKTSLPVINPDKCTACGVCVRECPRQLLEIRPINKKGEQVYVACRNRQKGAIARKNCKVACIGCQKCSTINSTIKVKDNLSYIPTTLSAEKYGKELSEICPTKAIIYRKITNIKEDADA